MSAPLLQRAPLVAVSLFVALGLGECGLRLWAYQGIGRLPGEHSLRVRDAVRGWALEPDGVAFQRTSDYGVLVRINAHGLRDRPHDHPKPPGVFRIAVLGDSFMEAYSVELEESLAYRLQEQFADRGVEVVNLGVGGYGTAQSYLSLRDEGMRYAPDLVVLAVYGMNDVLNDSRELQARMLGEHDLKVFGRPYARISATGGLAWTPPDRKRVRAYVRAKRSERKRRWWRIFEPTLLRNRLEQVWVRDERGAGRGVLFDPNIRYGWPILESFDPDDPRATLSLEAYRLLWANAWDVTKRLLVEIRDLAASRGAGFVVALVPSLTQVDPETLAATQEAFPGLTFAPDKLSRELAAACAAAEIPFLDWSEPFRTHPAGAAALYHPRDRHWNAKGHALATSSLAWFLDERDLVPSTRGHANE